MTIDDRALHELIVESEDLQADALRDHRAANAQLVEIHQERLAVGIDPDEARFQADRYNAAREQVLRTAHGEAGEAGVGSDIGVGKIAAIGALATGFGLALTNLMAGPAAAADSNTDVMILQTAASIENLAIATYKAALGLPFIKNGNATVLAFAQKTMQQHTDHGAAFNDSAKGLGGKTQTGTNPKYQSVVNTALPTLTDAGKVVALAISLEEVAAETYSKNTTLMSDTGAKTLMASVMGVEGQHVAILRAVGALLAGGGASLIAIPTDLAKLPAAAGSVGFPTGTSFEPTTMASPPAEGAVK